MNILSSIIAHAKNTTTFTIVGTTASGKSALAVALAKIIGGEVISADSRQIYRGLDLGSGKITTEEMNGIPHHLLSVADPQETYTVAQFVRDGKKILTKIHEHNKIPIVCGGSHLWVQALIEDWHFPTIQPNTQFRNHYNQLTTEEIFRILQKKYPKMIKNIDKNNRHQILRRLEILENSEHLQRKKHSLPLDKKALIKTSHPQNSYDAILPPPPHITINRSEIYRTTTVIALVPTVEKLTNRITKRLNDRLKQGMIQEVENLHNQGLSWERLDSFGLEYRWIARFLQKKIDENFMKERIIIESRQFAKRQRTWLRRWQNNGAPIMWIDPDNENFSSL